MIFQKTFHDKFINNIKDFLQFQDNFTVKNSYYEEFCHNFSDFSETNYNFMNNESFNNNIKYYNCDIEFSSNNQLHSYLIECKSFMLQISDKHLIIFT